MAEHSKDDTSHEEHSFAEHGAHDLKKYLVVFIALSVLTLGSFMTYFEFWRNAVPLQAGWFLMMAISCTKALLVMLFFMHLKYEASWKYVLTIPASLMSLFLIIMLVPDVGKRNVETTGGRVPSYEKRLFQAQERSDQPPPLSEPVRGQ